MVIVHVVPIATVLLVVVVIHLVLVGASLPSRSALPLHITLIHIDLIIAALVTLFVLLGLLGI